uniref:Uncharacterized protein n=1 Tax=Panagrolaimus sp. JU765 TaxID=591449 RepID=A0AC34QFS6_9BILA
MRFTFVLAFVVLIVAVLAQDKTPPPPPPASADNSAVSPKPAVVNQAAAPVPTQAAQEKGFFAGVADWVRNKFSN